LVNQIIAAGVESRASDIHIEPFEDRLRVRYRYDGVLHEAEAPPARLAAAITSRIKIMSRLDIAERRLPQDGRIKLAVRGQEIDFRVSTIPSLHGETVVLRILDRSASIWTTTSWAWRLPSSRGCPRRWRCPTASCWSPARPAAARPPRSTPGCWR
jgi:general secretion pathway protein E